MFVTSLAHARHIAQKLRKRIPRAVSEERSLEIVAWMYGYQNWKQLVASRSRDYSSFDEDLSPEDRAGRREIHIGALVRFGLHEQASGTIVDHVGPTRRSRAHDPMEAGSPIPVIKAAILAKISTRPTSPPTYLLPDLPQEDDFSDQAWIPPKRMDDETRRAILAPRPQRKSASVKVNAVFRGIPITVVKAVLKQHSSWFFPCLADTACRSAISLDVRTALGLHEELLTSGFLARGATEEDMLAFSSHSSHDSYGSKPAHITDKGKSIFKPGTKYMLRTSSGYDPDTPVDLTAFPPDFDVCDATWFNGCFSSSSYHRSDPEGLIHLNSKQRDTDFVSTVLLLSENNHLSHVGGSRHPGIELDGRRRFGISYEYRGSSKRDSGGEVVVSRAFLPKERILQVDVMPADEDNPPDGLSVNPDKWGYQDHSRTAAVQSVIAVVVGADLWRLALRHRNLPEDGRVGVRIRVGGGKAFESLRMMLRLLADERVAFLSHLPPDDTMGVSLTVV
ncbi:hypothetical protein [Rhizobium leguminosarum]|uniref:hypothetical protein n=1 Tax=Rhizobium leguminosarum TaxID=384 RepID=UPI002E1196D8|nr:hypothetical protein U8Q02_38870 [Rhizobium leguminosarum]